MRLIFILWFAAASTAAASEIQWASFQSDRFQSFPHYLALNLKNEPVNKVRKKLEAKLGKTLKDRGEAHVTVITPPEFSVLKKQISMDEIEKIARSHELQKADLKVTCLGKGTAVQGLETYFLVVQSKKLLEIRQDIEKLWKRKGGKESFQASHFFPHITLGFTERDLHESDGVIKDERSCQSDLSTL